MDTKTGSTSSLSLSPISIPPVGMVSAGMYLPEPVLNAADIAEESELPEWVVREKLGINQKRMAGPDDHPNQMAVWAAQDCLSKCDIPPEEIDVVLCTTEEWEGVPSMDGRYRPGLQDRRHAGLGHGPTHALRSRWTTGCTA